MRHDCVSRVGFIGTAEEAAQLFAASHRGEVFVLRRRMTATERRAIQPGDVYIYDSSCIERWIDGRTWADAFKLRSGFLVYKEVEPEAANVGGSPLRPCDMETLTNSSEDGGESPVEPSTSADGRRRRVRSRRHKPDGMRKRMMIDTTPNSTLRLICYYTDDIEKTAGLLEALHDNAAASAAVQAKLSAAFGLVGGLPAAPVPARPSLRQMRLGSSPMLTVDVPEPAIEGAVPRSPSFSSPTSTPRRLGTQMSASSAASVPSTPMSLEEEEEVLERTLSPRDGRQGYMPSSWPYPRPAYVNKRGSQSSSIGEARDSVDVVELLLMSGNAFSEELLPLSPRAKSSGPIRARRSSSMSFMPSPRASVDSTGDLTPASMLRRPSDGVVVWPAPCKVEAMPSQLGSIADNTPRSSAGSTTDVTDALWAGSVNALETTLAAFALRNAPAGDYCVPAAQYAMPAMRRGRAFSEGAAATPSWPEQRWLAQSRLANSIGPAGASVGLPCLDEGSASVPDDLSDLMLPPSSYFNRMMP